MSVIGTLKEKIEYFRQHKFVQDTAVLQAGSIAGNVIQAATGVVVARVLQPELFGVYALAMSLAAFASIFLSAGAQDAVTTILGETYTRGDRAKTRDAIAFLVKVVIATAVIAVSFALLSPYISERLYQNRLIGVYAAAVIGAYIVSSTFFSLTTMVLQVVGRIRHMMFLELSDQAGRSIIAMLAVLVGFGAAGAAVGHLVGALAVGAISFVIWERLKSRYPLIPSVRTVLGHVRHVSFRKYLGFSFWVALDRNIAMLFTTLPVLITGLFVSVTDVTFFRLGLGFMNLALVLMGPISKLLNVEFPRMKIQDAPKLRRNFIKVSLYSVGLSTVLAFGAAVTAPLAFKILYGESFLPSIKYVLALVPYGALFGIGVGLGPMWRAINKVKVSIVINILVLGTGVPLGMFLIKQFGLYGSVAMVSVWYTVAHLAAFFYLSRALKEYRPQVDTSEATV